MLHPVKMALILLGYFENETSMLREIFLEQKMTSVFEADELKFENLSRET